MDTIIASFQSRDCKGAAGILSISRRSLMVAALFLSACSSTPARKVVVLGIDGLDPELLQKYMGKGSLPHFSELAGGGDFKPLQTTMPPLSPVAWSTFITGMDPGGHGILDFLHRDPKTITPEFSMVKTLPSEWTVSIGSWIIPLKGGTMEQLRKGKAFWEILEDHGVPTTVFRMPVNFPPSSSGKSFSGMGTPDILGTPGTFSYYTDDPSVMSEEISGGRVFEISIRNHRLRAQLPGPDNPFRAPSTKLAVDFDVFFDPEEPVAKFIVQDDEFILKEGEWSDWIRVDFEAIPFAVSLSATARFYLQETRPYFRLYVTPLQINPEDPVMPLSTPANWSQQLQRRLGYFYTQELPEDTKAFSNGVFDAQEFWEQSQFVYREQRQALDHLLSEFREGFFFFYFSSVDQGSHMLWRYQDEQHPAYRAEAGLSSAIQTLYREMDDALGRILQVVDEDTTLIVMSDHGFGPFYWEVNLNSWLVEKGYAALEDPGRRSDPLFGNVEWSRTKAYALGLNGVYVNLRGRESNGIVSQGFDYERLLDQLEKDLLSMKDPRNGRSPVARVLRTSRDYQGSGNDRGPDLVVGYSWGYRTSWESPLGEFPEQIFEDNLDAWSGDHGLDSRLVPGVLLTNRKISLAEPALSDLTVAILDEYGLSKTEGMIGSDCLR